MIDNVLFLLAPTEKAITRYGYTFLPPLCLGILAGYLKDAGIAVELADLGQSLPDIYSGNEEQFTFLYQYQNIYDYLTDTADSELEEKINAYIEQLIGNISVESYDLVGISCGADFSFFQVHSA